MDNRNKSEVFAYLTLMAETFRDQKITRASLQVYTELLCEELSFLEIQLALKKILKNNDSPFFPSIAQIITCAKPVTPTDEMANMIASEIIECLSRFGSINHKELAEHLGDKYQIVERFGGWSNLSMIKNEEVPSTRAQLRDLAKAYINQSKRLGSSLDFKINSSFQLNKKIESNNASALKLKTFRELNHE